jgi:xanthine dehydrogenase small subunit
MLLRLGSLQIRNQGTLGGNIGNASPIGDTPPALIALRSEVVLRSKGGSRQVAVEDYFHDYKKTELQPGEFIYEILLPKPLPGYVLKVYKISKRLDDDISAVLMAIWIHYDGETVRDIVIACGGMAAIPKRALKCEQALKNKALDANTSQAAKSALGEDFQPIDDVRASAHYRMRVAQNLLTRLQFEMTRPDLQTQIVQHA